MLDTVIQKKINELPDNIRSAVEQFDWGTEVLHIARDNHLQIDDIEVFQKETLLVIVGSSPAGDFEKNLSEKMGISHELAESLVADANEHIFRPLQKIAFTHTEKEEDIVEHDKLSNVMSEEGIELVDEFEAEPRPENKLQDLADQIFETGIPDQVRNDNESSLRGTKQSPQNDTTRLPRSARNDAGEIKSTSQVHNNKVVDYNEPINEKDLQGISSHRIDTSILKQSKPEQVLQTDFPTLSVSKKTQTLDTHIFKDIHISKNESFDVSPTKEEQVVTDGDFLKHIGEE